MHVTVAILIGILGLIIGSFLNVVVYRINTGKGLGGRSMCLSCRKTLRWYELVPVVSFLIQGGRCRRCHSRISWQYPAVELVTAILFFGVGLKFSLLYQPVRLIIWLATVSTGVVISAYDLRHKAIPVTPLIVFFCLSIILGMHILGAVLVALPFFILWAVSRGAWIGFGDVELMACTGMILGTVSGYSSVFLSFWIAALLMIPWYAYHKFSRKKFDPQIPFGPFLILGIYLVAICGLDVLNAIMGMVH